MTWTSLSDAARAINRSDETVRLWIASGRLRSVLRAGASGRKSSHVVLEEAQALAGVLYRGRPRTREGRTCCGRKVFADGKCRRCYRRSRKAGA